MIAMASVGTSIAQTIDYIRGPGRSGDPGRASLLGGQGFGFEPKTDEDVNLAVQIMEHNGEPNMQASPTKKCVLNALHMSLSWHPTQTPEQDEMRDASREFLKAVGMESAFAIFHRHSDTNHPHLHIGASMIDPKTGLTYDRYQFLYKVHHRAIQWERDRDQVTPATQRSHDIADAAREFDFDRLKDVLGKEPPSGRIIDHALALGGHFGPHMAAGRAAFRKHLKREPEPQRAPEPSREPEPKRERPKNRAMHQSGEAERGDLEDLTFQTAHGRERNRQHDRGRGR